MQFKVNKLVASIQAKDQQLKHKLSFDERSNKRICQEIGQISNLR